MMAGRAAASRPLVSRPLMSRSVSVFEKQLREENVAQARQARVSVRRVRTQLGLATDRFDADWVWLVRRELRWIELAIGDVIDADALRCWIGRQELDERDEPARQRLVGELAREGSRAHRRLLALLDSARYERMVRDLDRPYLPPDAPAKVARREWRLLTSTAGALNGALGDQAVHRLAARVDRVRHATELCRGAAPWTEELARLRESLDALRETSLLQGWLRHAAGSPAGSWDLVAGQLLERTRRAESEWWANWPSRWERVSSKDLRAAVKGHKS